MQAKEHSIALSTGELTCYVTGEGRPLLHLHPAGGVRWTRVLEGLAASHQLHVPVMPGFDGRPAHPQLASMSSLAKLVGEFIDKAIGGPCDVIGHSFGGWLACWLALERPDLVDHLVLESPAGFRRGAGGLPADPQALNRALFAHPEKMPPSHKPVEIEAANRQAPARYHQGKAADEELIAKIGGLDKMTLIVQGTADPVVPKEAVQLLKSLLPRAYLVYVWDAAHGLEVDQPERTLAVVNDFLTQSEAFVVNWGTLARDTG